MSSDSHEPSPFSRPGFIGAAVVVGLILVVGGILVGNVLMGGDETAATPPPTGSPSAASAAPEETTGSADAASVCGLRGEELSGTLSMPPEAGWEFEGTTAYPTSQEHGPGSTSDLGVRYCFQRTPEGAVFAAANAIAQPQADPQTVAAWADYFVAAGQHRPEVLAEASTASDPSSDVRLNIAGFRLLQYDGARASVDIGVRGSAGGTPVVGSFVYHLVWQDGDWKLDTDIAESFAFAAIPDLTGYVSWAA